MKIRFASALLALSLPLFAQEPAAQAENLFYKAYWLEKSPKDFAQAMTLYEQFLAAAPDHKFAKEAAEHQFGLLDRTGKTKERDAFKEKYGKLLANAVATGVADAPPAAGDRPARGGAGAGGERPARGEGGGAGGRPDAAAQAARVADLEKQLEKAKAEGNEEQIKTLTTQLERAKAGGGRGAGGQGGGPGGRMGAMNKKLTEMTAEELTGFKDMAARMEERWAAGRANLDEEKGKKFDADLATFKKALADNKLEDAQKALDSIREAMPRGRRGGGGGGEGAGAGGGGTPPAGGAGGGRGGNRGGGGGGGR